MSLENQFKEIETNVIDSINGDYFCRISQSCVKDCIEITENFAIGFAEWLISSSILKTELPMSVKLKMYKNQKRL